MSRGFYICIKLSILLALTENLIMRLINKQLFQLQTWQMHSFYSESQHLVVDSMAQSILPSLLQ